MKKNNIVLTIFTLVLLGCSTYDFPQYKDKEAQKAVVYPTHKKIEHRFFLIGDAGYMPKDGSSFGTIAFKNIIDSLSAVDSITTKNAHALFLGDNIYPVGMPPAGDKTRSESEDIMNSQLETVENFKGNVLFVPGNHDWYGDRINSLNEQRDFIREQMGREDVWSPPTGCGIEIREISEEVVLVVIDTQWYLENWDNNPTINDNCPKVKTREAMLQELDNTLRKYETKNVVVAMHHPLLTNGVHGGNYHISRHLFPSSRSIPLPVLGSLATLVRTTGGVSIQDAQNQRYKNMVDRIKAMASGYTHVMFVAGHEHNLQYNIEENIHQIVSGSGSKVSYTSLRKNGIFGYAGQGFAIYDVFKDGSTWVQFYKNENNKAKLMFQQEVFEAKVEYDLTPYSKDKIQQQTILASIYDRDSTQESKVYKSLFGSHYNDLYGVKIEVPVAYLDTLHGGLEVMESGGGRQSRSLRLRDKEGKQYTLTALKKSAIDFLKAQAYKDESIGENFENTLVDSAVEDFYTAAHPYAFSTIPHLSNAINLKNTDIKIYYIPKQESLGRFNDEFGNELFTLEKRAEDNWLASKAFGEDLISIETTNSMFEHIRRDEKFRIDETTYIKARIFDMLIGDWDRHQDQWRWAEHIESNGDHIFEPIPQDRDQVFSNFDGAFFGTLRGVVGFGNQFGSYGENINDIAWFNLSATGLDRSVLQNTGKTEWMQQAKYIQENITDQVIEEAFLKLPQEIYEQESTKLIIENLKKRRGNIVEIAERYYNHMAKLAIITATDKDDFIDIERLPEGKTRVKIYRNIEGKRSSMVSDKIYSLEETNDIWIYGLRDKDQFLITGSSKDYIPIKIIGGKENDTYEAQNGERIKIYDFQSMPNTFDKIGDAKLRLTDQYDINTYDKDKRIYESTSYLPGFGYNPDDGIRLGVQTTFNKYKFKRNPYTSQLRLGVGYYFATDAFDLNLETQFANFIGNYNFAADAYYTSPSYTMNFFGYGNETNNDEIDGESMDYNRMRINKYGFKAGLKKATPFGSYFEYLLTLESVRIREDHDRFLDEQFFTTDDKFYDRKYFAGVEGTYRYESYDNRLIPTRGMDFKVTLGGNINTADTNKFYGYLEPSLEFYNAISRNRKWVINTHADSKFNFSDDFEIYQAAWIGGDNGLRGYRNERFMGESSLATGADLRYTFNQFRTRIVPIKIGLFAGADLGRVWLGDEDSKRWHNDFGGGLYIVGAQSINGKFNMFRGEDGWRFSFDFGFRF
ncbi:metallophosphoesterase [Mesonia sp. K7]|uniref:BamA/TamA family outer membrane protein n=1 Tax=Mesonia sp. K7 TaxID=2218606 RepID=UPI000DA99687|nr:metallophosphoesterase [Mesonia sp. K7]PZD79247.1 phosphoesterase [Mesonia sp. K7]